MLTIDGDPLVTGDAPIGNDVRAAITLRNGVGAVTNDLTEKRKGKPEGGWGVCAVGTAQPFDQGVQVLDED